MSSTGRVDTYRSFVRNVFNENDDVRFIREGVIDAGIVNGYHFIAIYDARAARLMIRCGCRWFTVNQARRHWKNRRNAWHAPRGEIKAALEYVIRVAKLRGWKLGR